jgi:hypothetical protein
LSEAELEEDNRKGPNGEWWISLWTPEGEAPGSRVQIENHQVRFEFEDLSVVGIAFWESEDSRTPSEVREIQGFRIHGPGGFTIDFH